MASYIEQVIARDEEILATAKITMWVWLWPVVITILTAGIAFPILLMPLIQRASTDLGVTNRRVIAKFGLISRKTVEQRIQKIESIRIEQGILGRICNYGTIAVHGTGGATTPIPLIADPLTFKRAVEAILDTYEEQDPTPAPIRRRQFG